ncbi:MAG: substrate-binding domain-containing protein [Planctomycetota bacterium]|nr:substrate-binding domain-containing protein [Planctomycetota bacterium]
MKSLNSPCASIQEVLVARIADGTYREKLPTLRALAREFEVNLKTIQKVVRRMEEAGLVAARQGSAVYLRGAQPGKARKTRSALAGVKVGFVCDGFGQLRDAGGYHPYYSEVYLGAEEAAREAGLDLRFIPTPGWGHLGLDEAYFARHVLEPGLRAMISLTPSVKELKRYLQHDLAFVVCGDHTKLPAEAAARRVPRLTHAWDEDVADGTRRILAAGHRRIAFIGQKGLRGFTQTLESFEVSVPEAWRAPARANGEQAGYEACRELLDGLARPTALMITDDYTCHGAMMALLERRVSVPAELSVLTVSNLASDLPGLRPLSALVVDGRREGRQYVRTLARELARPGQAGRDAWPLPLRFVDRGSIRALERT